MKVDLADLLELEREAVEREAKLRDDLERVTRERDEALEVAADVRRRARCARIVFPWNGVRWEIDYVAVEDADAQTFRGRSILVSASWVTPPPGAEPTLTRDQVVEMTRSLPGELERKATGWARRVLFAADELPRILAVRPADIPPPK